MPFPPPPPPPGPPPPPSFTPAAPSGVEGRGLLLQSIRQGTTLRKTVTNDKSAPLISGSTRPGSSSSSNTSSSGGGGSSPRGINGSATLGRANGLGGLFAGGMPKLKPTGVDIGQSNNSQSLTSLPTASGPGGQEQTRRQFNVDIKNRGPPPKPPPANQKPTMPQDGFSQELRSKMKHSDRLKSVSTNELDCPVTYQFVTNSSSPTPRNRPLSSYMPNEQLTTSHPRIRYPASNIITAKLNSKSTTNLQTKPPVSSSPFSRNSQIVSTPGAPQSPIFKYPLPLSNNAKPQTTLPPPISPSMKTTSIGGSSTFKKPFFTIRPLDNHNSQPLASPPALSPPPTPSRNEYNRYRDSAMTSPLLSRHFYLPPVPSSPRPRPVAKASLSKPSEFKIQRPQLSPSSSPLAERTNTSSSSTSDSVLTGQLGHNRSNSTTSLNTNNTGEWGSNHPVPRVLKAPPGGYGKPNVAPKPPGIVSKSPGKLVNGRPSVTRAQSMRAPRTPPVAPPQDPLSLLPNQSELYRGAPMFHQSQDSLLHTPPPPKHHTLPSPRGAPTRPPLRPPMTRPPPPPPNRIAVTSPPFPPPPPPTQAPPPPPHRVPLPSHRVPPTPVSSNLSPAPPPPPLRHSSMRNGLPNSSFSSQLEARYEKRLHLKEEFPPPQPFMGVSKMYNSRTAKQPAPKPPQSVHLPWSRENTSTC